MKGATLSMALLQSYLMVKRHSVADACSAAAEFAKGVNEARDARAMPQLHRAGGAGAAAVGAASEAALAAATGGAPGCGGGAK